MAGTDEDTDTMRETSVDLVHDPLGILSASPPTSHWDVAPHDLQPQLCSRRRVWGIPVGHWSSPRKDERP